MADKLRRGQQAAYASIALAFVLWYAMFVIRPFNFWLMMSFSTSVLACIAFAFGRPLFQKQEWSGKNLAIGFASAALLYGIFWLGNQVTIWVAENLPSLLPNRSEDLTAVYANRGALPPALVGALLFFPIGFGEEVFWRGFIQRFFLAKWNGPKAFTVTALLYVLVHLATGNPILIAAAFACGVFWSGLYWATGSLVPVLVSHMLWDPFIFILYPIM